MPAGLSVCVVLVVLCAGSLGFPFSSHLGDDNRRSSPEEGHLEADAHTLGQPHLRHSRSVPQLRASQEDGESRANLRELLARLISSRKGSVRRNLSANSRGGGPSGANHRIADRDYMGWMDFGRRSAEEYEYSS
ncbi:cholecystokinin-like [Hippocampus zosterae]|uniref:cholecystokinin-like n=1 Tax=Hippocampus zosterae TaxID=109293 RepID=UPI00223DD0B3|nr:cholecystokinin-like [Hippocampus zosterae]